MSLGFGVDSFHNVCHAHVLESVADLIRAGYTTRTGGSELFINPLMALYWCFRLDEVAKRVLYLESFRHAENYIQAELHIEKFRVAMSHPIRTWKDLPM